MVCITFLTTLLTLPVQFLGGSVACHVSRRVVFLFFLLSSPPPRAANFDQHIHNVSEIALIDGQTK